MRVYPHYRDSGVEWLGAVPEHWEVVPTKHASRVVMGQSPPSDTYQDEPGERPFLQGNAEFGSSSPTPKWYCDAAPKVVEAGALLLSVRAPVGALNVADQTYGIGRGLCGVVPDPDDLVQRFGWWTLHVTRRALEPIAVGSTYDAVAVAEVGELSLPLPPLDEQRDIAAFLDRETERIDSLIAKKRLLIERMREYRTALITRTVTRGLPPEAARAAGLDPSPRLKPSGVEWLGDVPEHWDVARLKWSRRKAINGVWGDEPDGENDIPCIRVADFDRRSLRVHFVEPTIRAVSGSKRTGRLLRPGDLLLEKSGGGEHQLVGCVVLWDHGSEAVCSNFIARVAPAKDADPRYWIYVHAALYSGRLNYPAVKQTTGIQNVDSDAYFGIPVAFPPNVEQAQIADFLDRESMRVDELLGGIGKAIERLSEYRTALITAAVTGKIDVRDAADAVADSGESMP